MREYNRCNSATDIADRIAVIEAGRLTELNRGRAFYAEPDRLGEYLLVDYVQQKRRRIYG